MSKISKRTASYSNKLHNSPKNSRVQKETITTKKKICLTITNEY